MKGYRENGGAGGGFGARNKTVYDDVFGGPPKFGATTLPPRLEDYTEIFQGFHASRGSSIPVLDLPPPCNDSDDVWFDVQSSKLDYSEVFGRFTGLDFAVPYEELFNISKAGDGDSSDDVWTPAQSETLSDELDPYTSMEMNQHVSITDPIELFGVQLQKEPNFDAEKDLINDIINHSHVLHDNEIENEKLFSLSNNNHSSSNHGVIEGKRLKKSFSQPLDRHHLSVSDYSLKTQPSNLPPPSRPPPVLSSKKADDICLNSKLKTCKSYGFEKKRGDMSPPYFDVEIDASSSAAVNVAAMKDAVEQAQAKLKSAKVLMDRKKEGLQIRSKSNVKKESVIEDERFNKKISLEKDNTIRRHEAINENQEMKMKDVEGSVKDKKDERFDGFEEKNKKISFELNEEKEDLNLKNVEEREVCGFEEKNERQYEHLKEPTLNSCEPRGVETSFVVGQHDEETKTPSEVDESESYDNLIEIELKNNDMEDVGKVVEENYENTLYDWEDYDVAVFQEAFEKQHEKELKESEEKGEKEAQQAGPPEIVVTTQGEEENNDHEKIAEEDNESDKISEDENKKEQNLNHNEKILHEENEIRTEETQNDDVANEKIETIHENSELQKDHESEEKEKKEEVVFEKEEELTEEVESDIEEISVVVDQADDELTSVSKNKETPQTESEPTNGVNEVSMENEKEKMEREKLERENERIRKLEEERERQIEREKDRMAIDRATLEACENSRAFSEIKERSERAAVERATAEFRQRALAEAREKLEKACAEARERSLAEKTMEGRLRVEKATAEARERAERSVDDKFFGSRNLGLRYSQNVAPFNGCENESPQRCKARLERHQRTADRAAKALAEKNMRDLLAQKEQAERNRLAEGLDAEVKRWCGGKQGNLRALLSTLQYILGPDSGWQPIPLTEVITTAAVKKAYRKATLCVHPDKLQQRGASIQQKYICEKVFDLLKEAWNKFNSEER